MSSFCRSPGYQNYPHLVTSTADLAGKAYRIHYSSQDYNFHSVRTIQLVDRRGNHSAISLRKASCMVKELDFTIC